MYMMARMPATEATWQPCVTGTVVDGSGSPIPQASVVVSDSSGNVVASATTATDGTFSIALPQVGSYSVVVDNKTAVSVSVNSSGVTNLGTLRG
jgi:Carboxypeptidase regulatory-like domain/Bacterial Ig domain